jgi:putative aldouronate transport system permease protein
MGMNAQGLLKRRRGLHYWRENYDFYLMLLPAVAFYIIFKYVPIYGITLAFKDFKFNLGILKSPWIGLEIFKDVFSAPLFWRAFRNTLWLNLLSLVVGFPMPIIFALCLNELKNMAYKRVVQTISYMPYFFSWVILYGIIVTLTAKNTGIFNIIFSAVGKEQIVFLTNRAWWLGIFIVSDIWKNLGWSAILYMSALSAIDPELYEAAAIDGAGRWKSLLHITLPGIKSTIVILLILDIGSIISIGLEKPFLLNNPMVNEIGSVLSVYVYNLGIKNARYSFSAAVGLFQSVINFVLIIGADYAAKALGEEGLFARKPKKGKL